MASHFSMSGAWFVCWAWDSTSIFFPHNSKILLSSRPGGRDLLSMYWPRVSRASAGLDLYQEWWKGHRSLSRVGFFGADETISDLINLSSQTAGFPCIFQYQTQRGATSVHYLHPFFV